MTHDEIREVERRLAEPFDPADRSRGGVRGVGRGLGRAREFEGEAPSPDDRAEEKHPDDWAARLHE